MKKLLWISIVVVLLAAGYLAYAQLSGGAVYTFGLPLGGEKAKIRQATLLFFEHVKFRNAAGLASMVAPETSPSDIDNYLNMTLGLDSRAFDLQKTKVDNIEIDSAHDRARVRISLYGQNLATQENTTVNKVVFLYRNEGKGWLFDISNLVP